MTNIREAFEREVEPPAEMIYWDEESKQYLPKTSMKEHGHQMHSITKRAAYFLTMRLNDFSAGYWHSVKNERQPVLYGLIDYHSGEWQGDKESLIYPHEAKNYNHSALVPIYCGGEAGRINEGVPGRRQIAAEAYQIIGVLAEGPVFNSDPVQNALNYFGDMAAGKDPDRSVSVLPFVLDVAEEAK